MFFCFNCREDDTNRSAGTIRRAEETREHETANKSTNTLLQDYHYILQLVSLLSQYVSQNLKYDAFTVFFFNSLLNILLSMLKLVRRSNFVQDTP